MTPPASLQIRLLGELQICREGVVLALPRSKKTRALCAYLVVARRAVRRERLAGLLWDVGEDRRASLRWSLSRLRRLVDDEKLERIVAEGEELRFAPLAVSIDLQEVREALEQGVGSIASGELERLVSLFRGPFLEGLDQPDLHEFQSWCVAERQRWRAAHVELLRTLVERCSAQPESALPHVRELSRLSPDDAGSWSALVRVLYRSGARTEAEEQYRLGLRRLEASGPMALQELRATWRGVSSPEPHEPPALEPAARAPQALAPEPERQRVQFCRAPDGVRIAYASVGSGPPLLKTANWMNHLEYDWKSPIWRPLANELTQRYTLVRYDQRGNGLSDWNVETFSFEAFVSDLEAVVAAAGLSRFPVLGISQGCAQAVEYAVRHPERVSKLVLFGGFARGWRRRTPEEMEARSALQVLIRRGWGKDNPAFRQLFSSLFMPEASADEFRAFNELQRVSCSPENAARIIEAISELDITGRLQHVRAPTLVLHCTEDGRIPFDAGRALAAGIPGARFVPLESKNHLLLSHEPAWQRFMSEVLAFLAEP